MKPAAKREQIINDDLKSWPVKGWGLFLPGRDYKMRLEDAVPALSGAIGKVSLVAAFALAWAEGYSIVFPGFTAEIVRLELFVASLFLIIFSVFFHTHLAPPGTLAPMISMIPFMVAAGVHPLSLGVLIGLFGIILSLVKAFPKVVALNSTGTRGGILVLFGLMGIQGSLSRLWLWSSGTILFWTLAIAGLICFLLLLKLKKAWLTIPACLIAALVFSALYGQKPEFATLPSLPQLNGFIWWQERWALGSAFSPGKILSALPFALLAVVMWPLDATAIQTMHHKQFYPYEKKVIFDLNASFFIISLRNLLGSVLGGAQIAAVWRSFLIPLGVVRRPIPGSALFLGVFCLLFTFIGYPIDLAVYPPVLHLVLIFGVFVPMLLAGLQTAKSRSAWILVGWVVASGYLIHPLFGWLSGVMLGRLPFFRENIVFPESAEVMEQVES